jgi:hypothetical protein
MLEKEIQHRILPVGIDLKKQVLVPFHQPFKKFHIYYNLHKNK